MKQNETCVPSNRWAFTGPGIEWLIAVAASAADGPAALATTPGLSSPPRGRIATVQQNTQGTVESAHAANSYPSGRGGWNASNTWYTPQAPYGNYAPPPYATSRSALDSVRSSAGLWWRSLSVRAGAGSLSGATAASSLAVSPSAMGSTPMASPGSDACTVRNTVVAWPPADSRPQRPACPGGPFDRQWVHSHAVPITLRQTRQPDLGRSEPFPALSPALSTTILGCRRSDDRLARFCTGGAGCRVLTVRAAPTTCDRASKRLRRFDTPMRVT